MRPVTSHITSRRLRLAYASVMSALLGLVWVATGAVAVGLSAAIVARHAAIVTLIVTVCLVSVGVFLVSCVLLVPAVCAVTPTIDSVARVTVICGGPLAQLQSSPYVETDSGPTFDPAHGACQAAAWHRVAAVSAADLALAVLVGSASVLRHVAGVLTRLGVPIA